MSQPVISLYAPRQGEDGEWYAAAVIRIKGEPVKVVASASESLVNRLFGLAQEYVELAGTRGRSRVSGAAKASPRAIEQSAQRIAAIASALSVYVPVSGQPSTAAAVGAYAIPEGQTRASMKAAALRNNAANAVVKAGKAYSGAVALAKVQAAAAAGNPAAQQAWNAVKESVAAAQANALDAARKGNPKAKAAILLVEAQKSGRPLAFILKWIAAQSGASY